MIQTTRNKILFAIPFIIIWGIVIAIILTGCSNQAQANNSNKEPCLPKLEISTDGGQAIIPTGLYCFGYNFTDGKANAADDNCFPETAETDKLRSCYKTKKECKIKRKSFKTPNLVPSKNAALQIVPCRLDVNIGDFILIFADKKAERASAVDPRIRRERPSIGLVVRKPVPARAVAVIRGTVAGFNALVLGKYYYLQTYPGKIGLKEPRGAAVNVHWIVGWGINKNTLKIAQFVPLFLKQNKN